MKKHWKILDDKKVEYHIEIHDKEKRILSLETTGHWKSEMRGYISFQEFLNGHWNDFITKTFGQNILTEIQNAVQALSN
jgi:hypothetical protein